MKEQDPKKVNQTFSIPIDVSQELHTYVKRREMSQFVSNAIRKELDFKKSELKKAYFRANEDAAQQEAMEDWDVTISDGSYEW